jgi:hypothetical protein
MQGGRKAHIKAAPLIEVINTREKVLEEIVSWKAIITSLVGSLLM